MDILPKVVSADCHPALFPANYAWITLLRRVDHVIHPITNLEAAQKH